MYVIRPYTKRRARLLGVRVTPSRDGHHKLDVWKRGRRVARVGALGYADYPTYWQTRGPQYARTRRRLYKQRHATDRHQSGSPGFYADQLLW